MAEIIIQLMSDLCAGNGESVGSGIDSDICTDNYGFPFIPGRRLLGCLRDTAVELQRYDFKDATDESINRIFGDPNGREGKLCLGNAMLPDIESMHVYIASLKNEENKRDYLIRQSTEEKIIRLYSSVRGQTGIGEDGKADAGSLRFIRVLNQYDPLTRKPLEFRCSANISELSAAETDLLENTCKALRHIGLNRNRGLGNVSVKLEKETHDNPAGTKQKARMPGYQQTSQSEIRCIPYQVEFESPVSVQEYLETGSSIKSRTMIGVFANIYRNTYGKTDEMFDHLFLDGTVKWSALTPVIDGIISEPAPAMLLKLKNDDGRLINSFVCDEKDWKKKKPKSIDGYFASVDEEKGTYYVAQPGTEINYHNRLTEPDGTDREKKGLYMQDSLKKGMVYGGYVLLPDDDQMTESVKKLLSAGTIRIGRSKKVQYGKAKVSEAELQKSKAPTIDLRENETVFAILKSDLVLQNEAVFITDDEHVRSAIANAFKLKNERPEGFNDLCRYHVLSGYNAMWQMQKPKIRAVRAGSVYCFTAGKGNYPSQKIIGEYQQEGLGIVEIISHEKMKELSKVTEGAISLIEYKTDSDAGNKLEQMLLYEAALEELREYAFEFIKKNQSIINDLPVGRLRQMLHDARTLADLWKMTESMKTSDVSSESNGKKEASRKLLSGLYGSDKDKINWKHLISDKQLAEQLYSNPDAIMRINKHWKEPLSTLLHIVHYRKGGRRR